MNKASGRRLAIMGTFFGLTAGIIIASCGPPAIPCLDEEATRVRYDPSSNALKDWLAHPFPSDHRVLGTGINLRGFPNPRDVELVQTYTREAEELLTGFGLNTPVYVAFDGPINPDSLPLDPASAMDANASLQIVDVDPDSPERGRRFPLRIAYYEQGDSFRPDYVLAAAPLWGFPLRERTTYALVLTRDVLDGSGSPIAPCPLTALVLCEDERCMPEFSEALIQRTKERLTPVRTLFAEEGMEPDHLVAATVFTTQGVTDDVRGMREVAHSLAPPSVTSWAVFDNELTWQERQFEWAPRRHASYFVMEGRYEAPYFIQGEIPYYGAEDGGSILTEEGRPKIQEMESIRFVLTVPDRAPRSNGCHPIVQYAHGTTGDAYGFTYSTAGRMAGRGLAAIGIDQPLHGIRNDGRQFNEGLLTFNVSNVRSTRSIFRQSAADTFSLTRLLKAGFEVPAEHSPTGQRICFDTDPMLFFGHSQGGITGSIAAAFEHDIDAWMLSGAGGGVGITVTERKDPIDLAALLALLGGVGNDETLDEFHPLVMLLHTLTEVTDPINYSPFWLASESPRHFLVTSGARDTATPHNTALAKTAAAGIPLLQPAGTESIFHDVANLTPISAPVSGNIGGSTAGHIHWPTGDHFVVFRVREAIHASMYFLDSAVDAIPRIERDPDALVR